MEDTQQEPVEPNADLEAAYNEVMESDQSGAEEFDLQSDDDHEEVEALDAPEHWAEDDRELFSRQPDEVKQYMLDRHKAMEGDYTRKSQARAADLKLAEALHESLEPYRQDFESQGANEVQAVQRLLEIHGKMKNDPASTLMELAQAYGYNPEYQDTNSYQSGDDSEYFVDPEYSQLEQKYAQLAQELNAIKQAQHSNAQQTFAQSLNTFISQADASGNEVHPFAGEVRGEIAKLVQSGIAPNMDAAYRMAMASKPELQEQLADIGKQREQDAKKAAVSKAKKAATGVKSSASQVQQGKPKSLREELEALYDENLNN